MSGDTGEADFRRRALAALAANGVFAALPPEALAELAEAGHPANLERGTPLFLKGDEGDAAFVVLEGELEVRTISKEGRELRIAAYPAGGLIGEMAVLDGAPRSADVVAARRSLLWRLPRAAVLDALTRNPKAAIALLAELTRRLRAANGALELASRRNLDAQLASLLVAEKNRTNHVVLTQTEMARRIGFSREKVNRKLHAWAGQGLVSVEPQGVLIKQIEAVRRLAP
jgi:CRP-like cAMP-binding protein